MTTTTTTKQQQKQEQTKKHTKPKQATNKQTVNTAF